MLSTICPVSKLNKNIKNLNIKRKQKHAINNLNIIGKQITHDKINLNDGDGLIYLAKCYYKGNGVPKDIDISVNIFNLVDKYYHNHDMLFIMYNIFVNDYENLSEKSKRILEKNINKMDDMCESDEHFDSQYIYCINKYKF